MTSEIIECPKQMLKEWPLQTFFYEVIQYEIVTLEGSNSCLIFGLEKCYLYQIRGLLGRKNQWDHLQIKVIKKYIKYTATRRYASHRIVHNFVKMTFDLRGHKLQEKNLFILYLYCMCVFVIVHSIHLLMCVCFFVMCVYVVLVQLTGSSKCKILISKWCHNQP